METIAPKIQIKFLSDKDFDALSHSETDGADVSDAIGFANTNTNRIFIRNIKVGRSKDALFARDLLNRYLVNHELEHLLEDEATDTDPDRPHIRFKKFRQAVGNIAQFAAPIAGAFIPGIGPIAGAALGGAVGSGLKAGIGGEKRTFSGVPSAALKGGAISGLGAGLLSGFSPPGQSAATRQLGSTIQTSSGPGFATSVGASSPFQSGISGAVAKGGLSGFGGNIASKLQNPLSLTLGGAKNALQRFNPLGGGQGQPQASTGLGPQAGTSLFQPSPPPTGPLSSFVGAGGGGAATGAGSQNIVSSLTNATGLSGKQLLGTGALATGLLAPFPKVPEIPSSLDELRSQIQAGGSPLSQEAQQALSGLLNQQFEPLSQPEIEAALRTLDQEQENAEKQVRDVFRSVRPGSDETSDSALRDALNDVRERFANLKQDAVANQTRSAKQVFDQQRMQQIQTALGANDQEIAQLTQLAQADLATISAQLNLDAEQARLFKETFLNIGAGLLQPPSLIEQFLASQV